MKAPVEYLYAAKEQQMAADLQAEGFDVTLEPSGPDAGFDLVATKDNRKLAFIFKTIGDLKDSMENVRQLRQRARQQGYDTFEVVVVTPPRPVAVNVEGLADALLENLPPKLIQEIESITQWKVAFDRVSNVEIDLLEVRQDGIHVAGSGLVKLVFHSWDSSPATEPLTDELPLSFDVLLDENRHIKTVADIKVSTANLRE